MKDGNWYIYHWSSISFFLFHLLFFFFFFRHSTVYVDRDRFIQPKKRCGMDFEFLKARFSDMMSYVICMSVCLSVCLSACEGHLRTSRQPFSSSSFFFHLFIFFSLRWKMNGYYSFMASKGIQVDDLRRNENAGIFFTKSLNDVTSRSCHDEIRFICCLKLT